MNKPICVKCEREFQMEKDCVVSELYQKNTKIYKLWSADLWICPVCGNIIVHGFASKPFMEEFSGDCEAEVKKLLKEGKIIIRNKEHING